jgi:predicted tellurium resistance membrane protein TerC
MEVVLGSDNLVFIAILSNRLPEHQRRTARRIGPGMAISLRFAMLAGASWLLTLTRPLDPVALSGKNIILIGKAAVEIHHRVAPDAHEATREVPADAAVGMAQETWVIVAAIVVAAGVVMMSCASPRPLSTRPWPSPPPWRG